VVPSATPYSEPPLDPAKVAASKKPLAKEVLPHFRRKSRAQSKRAKSIAYPRAGIPVATMLNGLVAGPGVLIFKTPLTTIELTATGAVNRYL